MKAAVVTGPGELRVLDAPDPEPGPYEVLVRTLAGGMCGTDRHIVDGTFYRRDYPAIAGHESIGEVIEVGKRVRTLVPGDRVLRTAAVRPGERLGPFGSMHGGFAELGLATDVAALLADDPSAAVTPFQLMQKPVPPGFDPVDVGSFIALKETLSWLRRLADPSGRRVLVVGTGPAAMTFVQVARLLGAAQVLVVGRRPVRLAMARRLGADETYESTDENLVAAVRAATSGTGVDIAIEAAGSTGTLEALPELLARGGIIGVYGVSDRQSATFRWGWDRPVPRAWSLRFEEPDEAGIHDEALELVRSGRFAPKSTLTHVLPFNHIVEALALMRDEGACKVAIDFRDTALPR
jgi:threonine dehydrogenase-like Zn-dependent dehydrogenase